VLCWNLQWLGYSSSIFIGSKGSFSQIPYPSCRTPSPTASPSVSIRPTISRKPTMAPTMIPPLDDTSIREAVDAWLADPIRAEAKYGHIRTWNTSQVTNLLMLFDHNVRPSEWFNEDLTEWDTSKVTSMAWLFNGAYRFNGDVATWDTSRVTWMKATFQAATAFNRNVSSWNTSSVSITSEMFNGASSFNCDLTTWDTSHVEEIFSMFASASSFNGDVSTWDTSKVTSMSDMFYYASGFNQVLCWNLQSLVYSSNIFIGSKGSFSQIPYPRCRSPSLTASPSVSIRPTVSRKPTMAPTLIPPLNNTSIRDAVSAWLTDSTTATTRYGHIRTWNTSLVTDMQSLFDRDINYASYYFNNDLSSWDVSRVTNMKYMFWFASSFNGDISSWETSKVTSMYGMFYYASSFNSAISSWNSSRVTSMSYMFYYASSFTQVLCWNLPSLVDSSNIFEGSKGSFSQIPYPSCRLPSPTASPSVSIRPTSPSYIYRTTSSTIYARYIKIYRVSQSPLGDNYIHILGVDVYDVNGGFISNQGTSSSSDVYQKNSFLYGPQFLIDGVHKEVNYYGSPRLAYTDNDPNAFMQLDFGRDVLISSVVLWNRLDVSLSKRILGCTLEIVKDWGSTVFHMSSILYKIPMNGSLDHVLVPCSARRKVQYVIILESVSLL